mmetsp:Transcript_15212/g.24238  ORF Transcript_15212/g.24238 Transcript_15212/m.24238 type:complete len:215 (-) Transcript_15212:522-1166(-)
MGWNYVAKSSTLWLSVPVLVIVLFIAATALRAYRRYLRSEREKAKGCHDAIFVLGGHRSREHYAARIACIGGNRHLPIFVSSGSYWKIRDFDPLNLSNPFRESFTGVDFKSLRTRLHLDRRAIDTVTNFTSMVRVFKDKGIKHVLVITSKSHIARGYAVLSTIFSLLIMPIYFGCLRSLLLPPPSFYSSSHSYYSFSPPPSPSSTLVQQLLTIS